MRLGDLPSDSCDRNRERRGDLREATPPSPLSRTGKLGQEPALVVARPRSPGRGLRGAADLQRIAVANGQEFAHCIRGDWGNLDYADIMAGVDRVIAQGYIDSQRRAAGGSSHGGYMTCWLLGHTDRFKAIVTERVVSNFTSFWGTSDIGQTFGA